MKKLICFFLGIIVAMLISCSLSSTKKILGTWKCDSYEITNMDELIAKVTDQLPDSNRESEKKSMKEEMLKDFSKMKDLTMTFKDDKTYERLSNDGLSIGTWSVSEDGKSLTVKRDSSEVEDKLMILELTDMRLVVTLEIEGQKSKTVFVK